jgi:hypothetical protein
MYYEVCLFVCMFICWAAIYGLSFWVVRCVSPAAWRSFKLRLTTLNPNPKA